MYLGVKMENFEEWQITYKVNIANPLNCAVPTKMIHEAFDAAMQRMVTGNKVAIGSSHLIGEKL
jgi:hypothetical protein